MDTLWPILSIATVVLGLAGVVDKDGFVDDTQQVLRDQAQGLALGGHVVPMERHRLELEDLGQAVQIRWRRRRVLEFEDSLQRFRCRHRRDIAPRRRHWYHEHHVYCGA